VLLVALPVALVDVPVLLLVLPHGAPAVPFCEPLTLEFDEPIPLFVVGVADVLPVVPAAAPVPRLPFVLTEPAGVWVVVCDPTPPFTPAAEPFTPPVAGVELCGNVAPAAPVVVEAGGVAVVVVPVWVPIVPVVPAVPVVPVVPV
jgi:hypothetical protein